MNVSEPIIKQSTIDFANKWNVGVDLVSEEEWYDYSYNFNVENYTLYKSPFQSKFGIKWHNANSFDRTIIMCNNHEYAWKNSDRIVFHELCHAIFEVPPNLINDGISPLLALDFKFVFESKVSNNIDGPDPAILKIASWNITGQKSIDGYCNHYQQELIDQGLVTESGMYTFDRTNVRPKASWFKN